MLYALLQHAAAETPTAPALVENGRAVSYAELLARADGVSGRLRAAGLRSGDTAGVRLPNSLAFVAAVFGISRLGAAVMPVDPALKADAAGDCLSRVAPRLVVAFPGSPSAVSCPTVDPTEPTPAETGATQAEAHPPAAWSEDSIAVLLVSSGTSGPGKIVPKTVSQARAALDIYAATVPYERDDRILSCLPFCHSFGFFNVLLAGLHSGAALFLESYSPRRTVRAIANNRLTVLPATPFMFRMMAETEFVEPPDLSCVRLAISAGSALPATVTDRVRATLGFGIAQSYGTTESGPIALAPPDVPAPSPGHVGHPYRGVTIDILDGAGRPLGPGAEGEIAVSGPANAAGYLGDPAATGNCFRDGRVFTGDVGYRDASGALFVTGRRKRMINVAGKKVAPDEVEACLLGHPGVADVLVSGTAKETGDEIVHAYVVARDGTRADELREYCAERLAEFKIPRRIEFVPGLVRGPMGKVPDAARPGKTE